MLRAAAGLVLLGLLGGCVATSTEEQIRAKREQSQSRLESVSAALPVTESTPGTAAFAQDRADKQVQPQVLKMSGKSWVGSTVVPVNAKDKLPRVFYEPFVLDFSGEGATVPLAIVVARLGKLVQLPVRIHPDVYLDTNTKPGDGPNKESVAPPPVQISGPTAGAVLAQNPASLDSVQMSWDGTLVDYLDHVTDQLGLGWEYRDSGIVIMRYVTEMYQLATFPNGYQYTLNSGASGSTSGEGVSSSSSLSVAESGSVNGLSTIVEVVKRMVAPVPGSEVLLAEGSGRLMVRTSPGMQEAVRDFIRAENANMMQQVQIQLDVYSFSQNDTEQAGINWGLVYNALAQDYGITFNSPTSGFEPGAGSAIASIPNSANTRFANSSVVINALAQIGSNIQYRPISLIALNRQWARKARLNTRGYLSETKPANSSVLGGGAGLPGLTTDSVTTGDQYAVMPFVLENNTVLLKMGMNLSDLLGLFEVTTGEGATLQRVQTPNTSAISDQYTVALRPGEVMAITGLTRDVIDDAKRSLGRSMPVITGGSRTVTMTKEHFLVFVRVVIL